MNLSPAVYILSLTRVQIYTKEYKLKGDTEGKRGLVSDKLDTFTII
jgi:hypothetical protein